MKKKYLLLLGFFLTQLLTAQEVKKVTLQEAIEMGLAESKQLKISAAKKEAIHARVEQYSFTAIPALTVATSYSRLSENIDPFTITIPGVGPKVLNPVIPNQVTNRATLSQTIFAGLRGLYLLQSTEYLENAAKYDYEKDRVEIKNNIINSYYALFKSIQTKNLIDENLKVLENRLYDTKNFESVGLALKNDVLKVDLNISSIQQAKAEIESAIEIMNYNLNIMLGLPESTILQLDSSNIFTTKQNASQVDFLAQAITNRNDLKSSFMRAKSSLKMVNIARGGYLPIVNAGFNYYYNNPNQRVFPQEAKFKNTWDVGVSLNWNLTTLFTNRFQVNEAKANLKQTDAANDMLTDAVKMDVNASYSQYMLALQKIDLTKKAVLQATENQRVLKDQFDNNIKVLTDLLDADLLLLQAKLNEANAKIDAETAWYKLVKSTGL